VSCKPEGFDVIVVYKVDRLTLSFPKIPSGLGFALRALTDEISEIPEHPVCGTNPQQNSAKRSRTLLCALFHPKRIR
jgi:hypothetical protein